jgi:TatD DNase family protein
MLIDSHCHLDFPDFGDEVPALIERAKAAGIGRILTISTRIARYDVYRGLAEAHPELWFTVGTHPHGAAEEPDGDCDAIVRLAQHPKCIAIGESGLDFFYDFAPRNVQEKVFRTHIRAARRSGLPLVIHARDADDLMAAILQEEMGEGAYGAVLHCFSSGRALAELGIELGFYVSFSGMLTFKRSQDLRAIAADLPLDRLLVETDSPFLAPQSRRGKRNEPAFVAETAAVLADIRGLARAEIASVTTANFHRCFAKAKPAGVAAVGAGG